jgi:hypothetical protein
MRVHITGGKVQLGREVTEVFRNPHETFSYGRGELDGCMVSMETIL